MSTKKDTHKAGFVHIIGKPNAGKSTLFNALVKAPLSIATPKAQTTRLQLIGIDNAKDLQVVYVDTPGYMPPQYALQEVMMRAVERAVVGADVLLWMVDVRDKKPDDFLLKNFEKHKGILFLLINKIDLVPTTQVPPIIARWQNQVKATQILPISALSAANVKTLREKIVQVLPLHPPYYDKDNLTDQPIRFFAAEIIRKNLFLQYKQEIPYSTEVTITSYKQEENLIRIQALIYTERLSQKKILIGKGGLALKKVGIAARKELESFLGKKVFLTQYVKVLTDWRKKPKLLYKLGYR